jgi:hypothetical protein
VGDNILDVMSMKFCFLKVVETPTCASVTHTPVFIGVDARHRCQYHINKQSIFAEKKNKQSAPSVLKNYVQLFLDTTIFTH